VIEADCAKLSIKISNDTDDLRTVSAKRKEDKKAVNRILEEKGFPKDAIEKEPPCISNNDTNSNDKAKKKFTVSDTINVRSNDTKLIRKAMMDVAAILDDDVCVHCNIEYYARDIDKVKAELIEEATKNAIQQAECVADATGKKIAKTKKLKVCRVAVHQADASSGSEGYYAWNEANTHKKDLKVYVRGAFEAKSI
jgi:hypothetical protein